VRRPVGELLLLSSSSRHLVCGGDFGGDGGNGCAIIVVAVVVTTGFGGSMGNNERRLLCDFIVARRPTALPPALTAANASTAVSSYGDVIMDYFVDVQSGEWRQWKDMVPTADVPSHVVMQADAVITTVDTLRHMVRGDR
jgi:hypothetical protein